MSKRPYMFGLVTYLDEASIIKVLLAHTEQIRAYAYALHDKDVYEDDDERAGELKEAHYHIVICTYNGHSVNAILRWFRGFFDEEGKSINTFSIIYKDKFQAYDYLDHSNAPDKYQYPHSIVQSNNHDFFNVEDMDTGNSIIEGMIKGVPYSTLRKRFGTHFVLNFQKYKYYLEEELVMHHYDPEQEFVFDAQKQRFLNNLSRPDEDLIF